MKITVQLFAAARDIVGQTQLDLHLSDQPTVADLRRALVEEAIELRSIQDSLLVAVNNEYASNEHRLTEDDEVACFPPVSGG